MKNLIITLALLGILLIQAPLSIHGHIDYVAAQPGLGGVEVNILPDSPLAEEGWGMSRNTLSDGSLTLELMAGVNHIVSISARGYQTVVLNTSAVSTGDTLNLNVTLDPLPLLEGYVKTADGQPVSGAIIKSSVDRAYSDLNGYFAIYVLPNETNIQVEPPIPDTSSIFFEAFNITGFLIERTVSNVIGREVNIALSGPVTSLNITLDYSSRVAGRVTFQNGSPVIDANVEAFPTSGNVDLIGFPPADVTDESGNYLLEINLVNGENYNISISITRPDLNSTLTFLNVESIVVTCPSPCNTPVNQDITIPNIVKVTGRVLSNNGRPVPNVALSFFEGNVFSTALTDSDGYFTLFLPTGATGNISVHNPDVFATVLHSFNINVGGGDLNLGDITIPQDLYYVSGVVDGYNQGDIFWAGTRLVLLTSIQLGFFNLTFSNTVALQSDGSFSTYVLTGFRDFLGNPIQATYSIMLANSYVGALTYPPINLGSIDSDLTNVVVSPNYPNNRFTLSIDVSASNNPVLGGPVYYRFIGDVGGESITLELWTEGATRFSLGSMFFRFQDVGGELTFFLSSVPGPISLNMRIPKLFMDSPLTVSFNHPDFIDFRPATLNIVDEGDHNRLEIEMSLVPSSGVVKVSSPNVIPEFPYPIVLTVLLLVSAIVVKRLRLMHHKLGIP